MTDDFVVDAVVELEVVVPVVVGLEVVVVAFAVHLLLFHHCCCRRGHCLKV